MKKILVILSIFLLSSCLGNLFSSTYKSVSGSSNYFIKGNKIYYSNLIKAGFGEPSYSLVLSVDFDTFKGFDGGYAKDKNNVYYNGSIIEGADSSTVESLSYWEIKDTSNVYTKGKVLVGADPKTIKFIKYGYLTDKNNSYDCRVSACKVFSINDNYVILSENISKDDKNIYWLGKELFKVEDFEDLGSGFYKNGGNIYFEDEKIKFANYDAFKVLNGKYANDKNYIYFGKNKLYDLEKKLNLEKVKVIGNGYSNNYILDDKNVYYLNSYNDITHLKNVDLPTFKVKDKIIDSYGRERYGMYAYDKNYYYYEGNIDYNNNNNTTNKEHTKYSLEGSELNKISEIININSELKKLEKEEENIAGYNNSSIYTYHNYDLGFSVEYLKNWRIKILTGSDKMIYLGIKTEDIKFKTKMNNIDIKDKNIYIDLFISKNNDVFDLSYGEFFGEEKEKIITDENGNNLYIKAYVNYLSPSFLSEESSLFKELSEEYSLYNDKSLIRIKKLLDSIKIINKRK